MGLLGERCVLCSIFMFAVLFPPLARADEIDAYIQMVLSGTDPTTINTQNLDATALINRLNQLAQDEPELYGRFQDAVLKDLVDVNEANSVVAQLCPTGSYIDPSTKVCTPCRPGTYSTTALSTSASDCLACPAGTYSGASGAKNATACVPCPSGTFSLQSGANSSSTCITCGVGSTSVQGASGVDACVCVPGYYRDGVSGSCVACEQGYWCSGNVRTACPGLAEGKSTSSPRSSAVEQCQCRPGYYGLAYFGSGCQECPLNTYCTGEQGENNYGKKFDCPAHSATAFMQSTKIEDCVCEASFRKQYSMPATRQMTVDAEPCTCTMARSPPACRSLDAANCVTCVKGVNCAASTTMTCKQGVLEMVGMITSTGAGNFLEWIIAPAGNVTRVSVSILKFSAGSSNSMSFEPCADSTCAVRGQSTTFSGTLTLATARVVATDEGYKAMRVRWTSTSNVNNPVLLNYSSDVPCRKSDVSVLAGQVRFDGGETISYPFQPEASWPMVVWIGDALRFTMGAITVDLLQGSPAGSSVVDPQLGLSEWTPQAEGSYWLVDKEYAGRAKQFFVAPVDARHVQVWYDVSGSSFVLSGDVTGAGSPDVVLVVRDVLTLGRLSSGHGVLIMSRYVNATSWDVLTGAGVVGQSLGSPYESSATWNTDGYDPGVYYYGSVDSLGSVKVGRIILYPPSGGASCAACREGEYCYDGGAMRCPANSRSPTGSDSISDCSCSPGFAVSTTDLEAYGNSQTIDSGGRHSCVVAQNGSLWCWGANEKGQIGIGLASAALQRVPRMVPGLSGVRNVSLGDDFTCAVYGAGYRVKCWGNNEWGQLGLDSTTSTQSSPGADAKLGEGSTAYEARSLACAGSSCCAIVAKTAGAPAVTTLALTCWGKGNLGQLGRGASGASTKKNIGTGINNPSSSYHSYASTGSSDSIVSLGADVAASVTMAAEHACAVTTVGGVWCWGTNGFGALGFGSSDAAIFNPGTVDTGGPVKTVNCYAYVCCAVMAGSYQVKCWGRGFGGRLGVGVFDVGTTPQSMGLNLPTVNLGKTALVMDVNVGETQTCALMLNNYVKCWGQISGSVVGDNPPSDAMNMLPNLALSDSRVALQMSGKGRTTCAVTSDYRAVCWGDNAHGQVGGNATGSAVGMALVDLPAGETALRSSGTPTAVSCAVCEPNTFCEGSGGVAQSCPANTQSPIMSTGLSSCVCLLGHKRANDGSGGCLLCSGREYCSVGEATECPANSATMQAGSSDISACQCDRGYYYAGSVLGCQQCQKGLYKSNVGNDASCTPCPAGTRSDALGLANVSGCAACEAGKISAAGAEVCSSCGSGTAAPGGTSACVACRAGFYAGSGAGSCTPCAAGSYDLRKDGTPGTCEPCTSGKFSGVTNATSDVCQDCAAGTFSASGGASQCQPCAAGLYSPSGAVGCTPCPANSTSSGAGGYGACRCVAGYFKRLVGGGPTFVCEQCGQGEYSEFDAVGSCVKCAAGTASAERGATTSGTCQTCTKGKFAASGAAECSLCGIGTISSADGAGFCTNCSLGYYAGSGATACVDCGSGKYSTGRIGSASQCLACPAGGYCLGAEESARQGKKLFEACPLGTFQNATGRNSLSQCQACNANFFCPSPTLRGSCPAGTTSPQSSVSQLQCVCGQGYTCTYTKVVNAVVTLQMTEDEWNNNADVQRIFIEAVALAAGTTVDQVKITLVKAASGGGGRRLLQLGGRNGAVHVVLEIRGGSGEGLGDSLDARMGAVGLRLERERVWIAPHAVEVRALL